MPKRMSKPRLQFKPLGNVVCKRCMFTPLSAEHLGQVPGLKTKYDPFTKNPHSEFLCNRIHGCVDNLCLICGIGCVRGTRAQTVRNALCQAGICRYDYRRTASNRLSHSRTCHRRTYSGSGDCSGSAGNCGPFFIARADGCEEKEGDGA